MTVKLLRAPHRWGIPEIGMTSHTMQRHCMGGRQAILHQTAEDYGGANIPTAHENRDSRYRDRIRLVATVSVARRLRSTMYSVQIE